MLRSPKLLISAVFFLPLALACPPAASAGKKDGDQVRKPGPRQEEPPAPRPPRDAPPRPDKQDRGGGRGGAEAPSRAKAGGNHQGGQAAEEPLGRGARQRGNEEARKEAREEGRKEAREEGRKEARKDAREDGGPAQAKRRGGDGEEPPRGKGRPNGAKPGKGSDGGRDGEDGEEPETGGGKHGGPKGQSPEMRPPRGGAGIAAALPAALSQGPDEPLDVEFKDLPKLLKGPVQTQIEALKKGGMTTEEKLLAAHLKQAAVEQFVLNHGRPPAAPPTLAGPANVEAEREVMTSIMPDGPAAAVLAVGDGLRARASSPGILLPVARGVVSRSAGRSPEAFHPGGPPQVDPPVVEPGAVLPSPAAPPSASAAAPRPGAPARPAGAQPARWKEHDAPSAGVAAQAEVAAPQAVSESVSAQAEVSLEAQVSVPRVEDPAWQQRSDGHVRAAKTAILMKEWTSAAAQATRALTLDPRNAQAALLRSEARLRLGDLAGAERDARLALAEEPLSVTGIKLLGRVLFKKGDVAGAFGQLQTLIQAKRADPETRRLMAAVKEAQGKREEAVEELREAARGNPAYAAELRSALAGARIGYPEFEESPELEEMPADRRSRTGWLLLGLAGLGLVSASLWRGLRRAKTAAWSDALKAPAGPGAPSARKSLAEKYEVLRVAARDSYGELLEARDRSLDRRVALRRVGAGGDPSRRERLLGAARVAATLRHPAIADVYEVLEDGPDVVLVLESLRGKTGRQMLEEAGRLPLAQALFMLRPACEALECAHGRGVAHRAVGPASLVVTDQGRVKLTDFGLAEALAAGPEPAEADRARRADLHDLAVCLYELVTGAKPFEDGASDGRAGLRLVPPSRRVPGLPAELDALIEDALAPAPEPRIKGAGEFLARLAKIPDGVAAPAEH
ncbi:MAG: protein kinase [Elusimicrobia bacterium]|nr:protein kinase [Elusimicrobiota bacterium]